MLDAGNEGGKKGCGDRGGGGWLLMLDCGVGGGGRAVGLDVG